MRHGTRLTVVAAALSVLGSGCATVEWTEDLFAKRQVEVDERFVRVETDVRQQGERVDRVEVRLGHLDTRLTETGDLVRGTLAQASTTSLVARPGPREGPPHRSAPERAPRNARTLIGVVNVPFGFDRADLGPTAEAALASILTELQQNPSMTIDLEGTTDAVGRLDYNLRLSQRRVEAVRGWLMAKGVEQTRIVGSRGIGPVASVSVKDEGKRRVMIKLMTSAE
jgi:outer membrane protein OmpA-like peptidoglycan-associated protein